MIEAETTEDLKRILAAIDVTVPRRSEGRTKEHVERYAAVRLLATIAPGRLEFPMRLTHRNPPEALTPIYFARLFETLPEYVRGTQLAAMMIVGDGETAEDTDAGGYECEHQWVYGDGKDKGNDRAADN
jgi:hypothetical protein